jgi:hypothetical protein
MQGTLKVFGGGGEEGNVCGEASPISVLMEYCYWSGACCMPCLEFPMAARKQWNISNPPENPALLSLKGTPHGHNSKRPTCIGSHYFFSWYHQTSPEASMKYTTLGHIHPACIIFQYTFCWVKDTGGLAPTLFPPPPTLISWQGSPSHQPKCAKSALIVILIIMTLLWSCPTHSSQKVGSYMLVVFCIGS